MNRDDITNSTDDVQDVSAKSEMFGFTPDDYTKIISLPSLEKSIRVEGKHGRTLQTRPVQAWNAITYILGLLEKASVNYSPVKIYVQKRNAFPMLNDDEKKLGYNRENCPINRWLFDKILAFIQLPNISAPGINGRIGFGFNDDGIQIAFGMNVSVCTNFNIMGGHLLHTYKNRGYEAVPWSSIELHLKDWVANLDQMFQLEMNVMNRLQAHEITDPLAIDTMVGGLYRQAINQAYGTKEPAPFDTAGMSLFVQKMIAKRNSDPINTAWDLYNYGTSIMSPETMDLGTIQDSSHIFAEHILNEFHIPELPEA